MPATFQKTIDKTLHDINSKFAYLDDILIITKGTLVEHEKRIRQNTSQIKRRKPSHQPTKMRICKRTNYMARLYNYSEWSNSNKTKMRCYNKRGKPKNPKTTPFLHGLYTSPDKIHSQPSRNIRAITPPTVQTKHKSTKKLDWKEHHTKAFNQIKDKIKQIIENRHFDTTNQTRVRCDASKKGLGACLEQKYGSTWETIAFASRFLNNLELRYSTNELELLAVVWPMEHFKYYLYGSGFILQTDHQALLTALKENRGNKTYRSRLTRWVDRLLPFHFSVEHIPGKNMGFADYLSRNPSGDPKPPSEEDKNFVINVN